MNFLETLSRRIFVSGLTAGVVSLLLGSNNTRASKNPNKKKTGKKKKQNRSNGARDITSEIIGGTGAAEGEYPFMVAIGNGPDPYYNQQCGGFLLSDRHVGTAAHCAFNQVPSSLWLHIGYTDLTKGGGVSVQASEIKIHPKYSWNKDYNDFAVITFSTPVDTSLYSPAVLADSSDFLRAGESGIVLGWGNQLQKGNLYPALLQEAIVPIYSDKVGKKDHAFTVRGKKKKKGKRKIKTQSWFKGGIMIAADKPGTGTCDADSGGPLGKWDSNGRFRVRGITSWGADRCASKQVGVYADVVAGLGFFNQALSS